MKKTFRLLLMALPMLLGIVSCAEKDNPVDPNPLAKQVSGLWWSLADQKGTLPDYFEITEYSRLGMAYQFNEDGTGYGIIFFFNDENGDPLDYLGGETIATLSYTTTADGRIKVEMTNPYFTENKFQDDFFKQWKLTYTDGIVTATNGKQTLTLEKASEQMAVMIHDWDQQFNGGAAIGGSGFNPNDEDFTFDNWRNEPGIYLYDGTGEYTITQKGRTCKFSLVPLPWYEGTKLTNLPEGFCDDITPENGWELALNLCGNTEGSIKNNNFFALYNKYLGILRFFYFMPEGFTSGNDHVWQVSLGDNLAQHSLYGYGVPSDRTVNKAAIGQTGAEAYMEYVTPWVDYQSNDGLVVPNAGWWAFDVDLSMYRANANHDTKSNIKLQMRSWDKHATSLYSAMTANIDGTIKASLKLDAVAKKSSSTAKGVLMGLQAAAQAGSAIANFASNNWAGGLTSLGQMFGTGSSFAGLGGGSPTNYTGSLDGTISLGLDGNINTDGVISGSKTITGIPSPTLSLKDFDLKNSHIGQGVWNLKTAPVVYKTNIMFGSGWDEMVPYIFDPSSIEVELNHNVFPESEIEWMQVDALCIARKSMQVVTDKKSKEIPTDNIRLAYGVSQAKFSPQPKLSDYEWKDYRMPNCLIDFLYRHEDKLGLIDSYYLENDDGYEYIVGRGNNNMAIEPQYGAYFGSTKLYHLPFLEVNVKVLVKMKGMQQPVVLSRNYLPEIKEWGLGADFAASAKKTRPYASKMNGHTDLYDYQMKRISDIIVRCELSEASEIPLSKVTSDYVAKDGDVLTGTLGKNVKISIADGATVTLKDATINGVNSDSYRWAGITCEGDATIILKGNNTVKGFHWAFPGISVPTGKTLTIYGSGSLNVSSGGCASGIGAGYTEENHCGNIVIAGGSIAATGGQQAAGIGGGYFSNCGSITITSGVTSVTATKGMSAPNSIGAGYRSSCGTVTIGGKVTGNITESPYTYKP